jgi:hypothetical protein
MKSLKKIIVTLAIVIAITNLSAQVNPPTPNGDGANPTDPGSGNTAVGDGGGGGAPIGGGLFILLGLGAAYGGKKIYGNYQAGKDSLEA